MHKLNNIDLSYTQKTEDLYTYDLSVKDLFEHYQKVGFLSKKKKERISPYKSLILKNWESALSSKKQQLLWVPVCKSQKRHHIASMSTWRSTKENWLAQHLTSDGNPAGLVSVLLNSLKKGSETHPKSKTCQHWYSPDNNFANKIHEGTVTFVGKEYSSNQSFELLDVDPKLFYNHSQKICVKRCNSKNINDIITIADETRGKLYIEAEELNSDDLELNRLDSYYREVGLRRKRYIWIAYDTDQTPIAAAICYRGPLGLNLSLLENRCDLLIRKAYRHLMNDICNTLIIKVKETYFNKNFDTTINNDIPFPFPYIPLVTDKENAVYLKEKGAKHYRNYNQCIWHFEGIYQYFSYIEKLNIFKGPIKNMKGKQRYFMSEKKLYNTGPTLAFIKMIKKRYPHVDTEALIKYMGKETHQLEDSGQWLTQEEVNRFYEKVIEVTGNKEIAREAGKYAVESEILGSFKRYLLALGSPELVYKQSAKIAAELDRSAKYESNVIRKNTAEIIAIPKDGVKQELFQCQNRYGNIEQVPLIFGCQLVELKHDECIFKGGKRCRYVVQWSESKPYKLKKLRMITIGSFLLALLGAIFLVEPISQPLIAGIIAAFLSLFLFFENQEKIFLQKNMKRFSDIDILYYTSIKPSDFSELFKSIGETIGGDQNIDNILTRLINPLDEHLDFDFGVIFLSDEQKTRLKFAKGYGLSKEAENILANTSYLLNNINMADQYFNQSFYKKKPIILNALNEPAKLSQDETVVKALMSNALIVCPIIHYGESFGIIAVFHKEKKRELIQRDINILMGVASTIGGFISKTKI